MLLGILLAILILVCIALGGVVLLQRSEGGALGMGGGPSGFLTTRGAGDLLTRTTWILGGVLFALCLALTVIQGRMHKGSSVVDRLKIDPLNPDSIQRAPLAPPPVAPANTTGGAPVTGFEAPAPQVNAAPALAPPPAVRVGPTQTAPAAKAPAARPAPATPPASSATAPVAAPPEAKPAPVPAAPAAPASAAPANGTGG